MDLPDEKIREVLEAAEKETPEESKQALTMQKHHERLARKWRKRERKNAMQDSVKS